jgi:hypothetical protein
LDISDFETATSITAENKKPRLNAQKISRNIVKAIQRA